MANSTIPNLPAASAPDSDDQLLLIEDGVAKNLTLSALVTALQSLGISNNNAAQNIFNYTYFR